MVGGAAATIGTAPEERAAGNGFYLGNASCSDHHLCHHGTAGMPHIDAETGHEAVNLLADF